MRYTVSHLIVFPLLVMVAVFPRVATTTRLIASCGTGKTPTRTAPPRRNVGRSYAALSSRTSCTETSSNRHAPSRWLRNGSWSPLRIRRNERAFRGAFRFGVTDSGDLPKRFKAVFNGSGLYSLFRFLFAIGIRNYHGLTTVSSIITPKFT